MLQKVSIQNFKSLKDVTLELQKVNLLIGPNNSGKSNFLKALELLANYVQGEDIDFDYLMDSHYRKDFRRSNVITLLSTYSSFELETVHYVEIIPIPNDKQKGFVEFIGKPHDILDNIKIDIRNIDFLDTYYPYDLITKTNTFKPFGQFQAKNIVKDGAKFYLKKRDDLSPIEYITVPEFGKVFTTILDDDMASEIAIDVGLILYNLGNIKIYKPDPNKLQKPFPILPNQSFVNSDASNLVAFLDILQGRYRDSFVAIENDLNKCIPEFSRIELDPVEITKDDDLFKIYGDKTFKRLGLYDNINKITYWADELSEGTLYFLALLCIVHQPNPPKLLLLEEPEKGIHPRRIKEVIDFIFQLTEDKDIQVIMTTHSERVLDEFEDIPEAVFVFDKDEEGATQVKNLLKDVIGPSDKLMDENNVPKIKFTESLGSHWITGFIGGVPR
jgi:AAA15 family ATPase/GTPase